MPSHSNSVARSALWNHAGRLTDYVAWYCSSVLIARGLGVDLNGVLAGWMSGASLLLAFSSLGLEVALNKVLPQLGGDDAGPQARAIVRRTALARLLLTLAVATVALLVVGRLLAGQQGLAQSGLVILLLYALLRGLASLAAVVLIARWHTDRSAIITGATRLLELAVILLLYNNSGMTLDSVVIVLTATMAVQFAGYVVAARQYWFGSESTVPMRPIWVFGTIFWANTVVDYFLGRQGDIMFLRLLSPFASSAALYDVSYSLMQAGAMAVTVGFSGVTLAKFAHLALGERTKMDQFYGSLVRITTLLMVPTLGFIFVGASDIIRLLYSETYAGAVVVLQVMVAFRILSRLFAGGENADYLLALEKVGELVGIGIIGAGVTVVLHLILIPRYDAVGAAWGAGIGTVAANMLGILRVRKYGAAGIQWRTWAIVSGTTITAGLLCTLVPVPGGEVMRVFVKGCIFVGSVLGLSALFRPVEAEDARALSSEVPALQRVVVLFAREATSTVNGSE